MDVRASGQAALIPLGAYRVCSTLPKGVWLLNCPVADSDVEERDLAQLPSSGCCQSASRNAVIPQFVTHVLPRHTQAVGYLGFCS